MAQLDTKVDQDAKSILSDVLNIVATHQQPDACVPPIMHIAQHITGAVVTHFYLIGEPRLLIASNGQDTIIPDDEAFDSWLLTQTDTLYFNANLPGVALDTYAESILAPIHSGDKVVGMLLLVFDKPVDLSDADRALLLSVIDGLKIVAIHARSLARHQRLIRNQSEFTRTVSHDLRSPLTSVQGFASMLESGAVGELNERQAYFIEKVLSGLVQMTSLIDNIQDAGRYDPETGFYEMERTPLDVIEIVQKIVNNHLVPAEKQELTISVSTADDIPIIRADSNMLERALINLVDNAIKYTPNGGHVEVGVERRADKIVFSVHDDGLGISRDDQKRLFDRYVRIRRREHKKVKGSGLGLFIVRSVAHRHGGEAWVESAEGQGSTFFISIPLDEASQIVSEETAAPE